MELSFKWLLLASEFSTARVCHWSSNSYLAHEAVNTGCASDGQCLRRPWGWEGGLELDLAAAFPRPGRRLPHVSYSPLGPIHFSQLEKNIGGGYKRTPTTQPQ